MPLPTGGAARIPGGRLGVQHGAVKLIAARVPELSQAELDLIETALAGDVIPTAVLDDIMTVIGALEDRLNAYVEALYATMAAPLDGAWQRPLHLFACQRLHGGGGGGEGGGDTHQRRPAASAVHENQTEHQRAQSPPC